MLISSCNNATNSNIENWEILFNGKDLKDWKIKFANQDLDINHKNTVRVKDSVLKLVFDNYDNFDDNYAQIY